MHNPQPEGVLGPDLFFDAPDPLYVARCGAWSVEVGRRLKPFLEQLRRDWQAGAEDLAVWMHSGGRTRLVAVLRDGPGGSPLVTWL
jgi:hypothetical protein